MSDPQLPPHDLYECPPEVNLEASTWNLLQAACKWTEYQERHCSRSTSQFIRIQLVELLDISTSTQNISASGFRIFQTRGSWSCFDWFEDGNHLNCATLEQSEESTQHRKSDRLTK